MPPRSPLGRCAAALVMAAALAACSDRQPLAGVPPAGPRATTVSATYDALQAATYWRSFDTLWVYDTRPEVGIGSHLNDDRALAQVRDGGMRLVRLSLIANWYARDAWIDDGIYSTKMRARLQRACDLGLQPVVVVHSPGGYMSGTGSDADFAWFAGFMTRVVQENPCVRFWQLWNEMEVEFSGSAMFGAGTDYQQGVSYARMLQRAYPAVKAANPQAWVLAGGLTGAPASWAFLRGVYDGGGRQYFDFAALHVYGSEPQWDGAPNTDEGISGDGMRSRGERIRKVMAEKGDAGRPVWITEFGTSAGQYVRAWGLPPEADDGAAYDAHQKGFWAGALDIQRDTRYFVKLIGYQLFATEDGAPAGSTIPGHVAGDYTYGIVRADGVTPRPTYTYLRDERPVNMHAFTFPEARGSVTVYAPGRHPVGYAYTGSGGYVTFTVTVDKLVPTAVAFEDDAEEPAESCFPRLVC